MQDQLAIAGENVGAPAAGETSGGEPTGTGIIEPGPSARSSGRVPTAIARELSRINEHATGFGRPGKGGTRVLQADLAPQDISTADDSGQTGDDGREHADLPRLERPYRVPSGDPEWAEYLDWLAAQADEGKACQ